MRGAVDRGGDRGAGADGGGDRGAEAVTEAGKGDRAGAVTSNRGNREPREGADGVE